MSRKVKYNTRPDGRRETTRTYIVNGKRVRKHFYGLSDAEVDKNISEYEKALSEAPRAPVRPLSAVADEWWALKEPELSLNSLGSYRARLKEIKVDFGDVPVSDITAQDLFVWLSRAAAQGYSNKTMVMRRTVLKAIFDRAIVTGELDVNPCNSLPSVKGKAAGKRHAASDEDVEKIEACKNGGLIARMFYFMEYTGCRVGECAVLQEKDIDRAGHKARISKDLAFDGQLPVVKPGPKTDAGFRDVDLYDNVLEILPEYDDPETFVFFPEGLPRKSPYETALRHFRKEAGITATAHQLRHTYAGIMHSAEIDVKDTQSRMGHSSVVITQDIYTEIERAHNEKTRNKANKYIMEQRLARKNISCPSCGSTYVSAPDGHRFTFCPDCGKKIDDISDDFLTT